MAPRISADDRERERTVAEEYRRAYAARPHDERMDAVGAALLAQAVERDREQGGRGDL